MKHFWKYRLIDWLLCSMISVSLIYAVCSGFILEDPFSGNAFAVIGIALIINLILVMFTYNRKTVVAGIAAGVVVVIIFIVLNYQYRPVTNETENSTMIFFMIAVAMSVYAYLLGRSRAGIIVLFVTGILIDAGAAFLQWPEPAWSFLLLPAGCVMLYMYRVFSGTLAKVQVGQIKLFRYIVQTIVVGVLAFGISLAGYYGIVRPLNPPTQELKLIQQLMSMDILERLGVSTTKEIFSEDLISEEDPEDERFEDEEESTEEETETEAETSRPESEQIDSPDTNESENITYEKLDFNWLWLLLLIPVAIAVAYIIKHRLRKSWKKKVDGLQNRGAVINYYTLFTKDLAKAGIKRQEQTTLREFAALQEYKLSTFDTEGVTFAQLTGTYEKTIYGKAQVTDKERESFETYYSAFYENLKKEVGKFKYYLTLFRY